ncbi:hypothetical protein ABK040_009854 [Willaertia magna]
MVNADMNNPSVNTTDYPTSNVFESDGANIYWRIQSNKENPNNPIVEVGVIVKNYKGQGWFALGIDHEASSGMRNADCISAYYDTTQKSVVVLDYFLSSFGVAPRKDGTDNILAKNGKYDDSNQVLHVKFTRLADTGDKTDDKIIKNETIRISYAVNVNSNDLNRVHTSEGKFQANLLYMPPAGDPGTPAPKPQPQIKIDYKYFHLIVTAGTLVLLIILGFIFTCLPIFMKPNLVVDLILYRKFSKLVNHQHLSKVINTVLDVTIGELIVILVYFINLVVWAVYGALKSSEYKVGISFAYVNVWNFSLILIPITRYSMLLAIFGISYERSVKFHRWLGRVTHFFVTAHFIAMIVYFAQKDQVAFLWSLDSIYYPLFGFISWVCLTILVLFTFEPIRRRFWELFQYSHIILALLTIGFAIAHGTGWINLLPYMAISLFLYFSDLICRFIFGVVMPTHLVQLKYDEASGIVVCTFRKKINTHLNIGWKKEVGSYVFLYIPRIAPYSYHPFTVSSMQYLEKEGQLQFTCHIKDMGRGFTNRLAKYAKEMIKQNNNIELNQSQQQNAINVVNNPKLFVRSEGFYGNITMPLNYYKRIVLIGGGIGITFINSIFEGIVNNDNNTLDKSVHLFWTARNEAIFKLFPNLFIQRENISQEYFVTEEIKERSLEDDRIHYGKRPNVKELLQKVSDSCKDDYIAVLVCGPNSLLVDASNAIFDLNWKTKRFHLHKETFEL